MASIVPSAAAELLYRLTETLEIPFTLTDRDGVVVASTAGRPTGQVDPYAITVVLHNSALELTEEQLMHSPAAEVPGVLQPAPGVYVPVKMTGRIEAVLFARGEPSIIRTKARSAAAAAGLSLEFASGASDSMRETLGPDVALTELLKGTQSDARRATLMAKVAGWDLLVPRSGLVILAPDNAHLPDAAFSIARQLLTALTPAAPFGRLGASEWVALPAQPRDERQHTPEQIAHEILTSLTSEGVTVLIGVGETHIDLPITPGLRRSYREARFCAEWANRLGAKTGVFTLRSLGALGFLAPGAGASERYANALLEPLRQVPDIMETVRVFLDADLSMERAAKLSGQHRHTVRSHLLRARDLTGLDARTLSDAIQLKLALLISSVHTVEAR